MANSDGHDVAYPSIFPPPSEFFNSSQQTESGYYSKPDLASLDSSDSGDIVEGLEDVLCNRDHHNGHSPPPQTHISVSSATGNVGTTSTPSTHVMKVEHSPESNHSTVFTGVLERQMTSGGGGNSVGNSLSMGSVQNPIDKLYSMQNSYFSTHDCDCVSSRE
ncbi:hypothetical protein GQR58_014817 [Nymphon striatum]|nr:hypothetical protein GQR58_014817 [Nymphon striatum]